MSLELLDSLENSIRPSALLTRLLPDLSITYTKDHATTHCPACAQTLWILNQGFLCSNKDCTFRAGSVVDLLTLRPDNGGQVAKAVDTLLQEFVGELPQFDNLHKEELAQLLVQTALRKRGLFDFFIKLGRRNDRPISIVRNEAWLAQREISTEVLRRSVYCATEDNLLEFRDLCAALDLNITMPSSPAIMMPYFGNHHSVAHVVFIGKGGPLRQQCIPYRFSFWGLNEGLPSQEIQLVNTYLTAAQNACNFSKYETNRSSYAIWYDSRTQRSGYIPEDPVFMHYDEEPIAAAAALHLLRPGLRAESKLLPVGPTGASYKWLNFLVAEALRQLLQEKKLTPAIQTFLDTSRIDIPEQQRLVTALHQHGLNGLATTVADYMKRGPVYRDEGIALYEEINGYYLSKKGVLRTPISNFTLKFKSNLVFPDHHDSYHSGSVVFNGVCSPLCLNRDALDSSRELETAVRGAWTRHGGGTLVPSIGDRVGVKYLQAYIRSVTPKLPVGHGLNKLGWNEDRSVFYGPAWRVREKIENFEHTFHPDVNVLGFYNTDIYEDAPLLGGLSSGLCSIIAQAVAMVVRSYLYMPIQSICIQNTPFNRDLLKQVFAGMNQVDLVRLNPNVRTNTSVLPGLCGYPFVGCGYSHAQVKQATLPAFMLVEDGNMMFGEAEESEVKLASALLRQAVTKVALWMIQTEGREFNRIHSVSNEVELVREGQELLSSVCGFTQWPESPVRYQLLEKVLQNITPAEVPEVFSHHLEGQRLYIDRHKIGDVDQVTFELELKNISKICEKTDNHFAIASLPGNQLINNFYQGKAFAAPISKPPSDPGSPPEAIAPGVSSNG